MGNKCLMSVYLILVMILCLIAISASPVFADEKANESTVTSSPEVEISLVYQRQNGIASNQFAVWMEDSSGKYIKTLYTTRFTAEGGWEKRPQALPGWVKASQPLDLSSEQIDAITSATPSAGNLTYVWDCKDDNGAMVPAGEYKYIVEATLRWDNRVLYTGTIKIGDTSQQSQATSEFFGDSENERGMITNVSAKYIPSP